MVNRCIDGLEKIFLEELRRTFDTQSINHIMAATNRYYKKVGTWYLLATAALAIGFPIAVDSELSYFTIFAVALQLMYFAFNIIQILYIWYYIKKEYAWLDLSVTPNYDAISQRNSVMVHQISGLIFQNTDVLVLTFVCGLKTVSVYSMYVMLFGMVSTAVSTINSGISFAMGQAYNTDKKKFNSLYNAFETYNMALTFSLYCTASLFVLPFLKLYTAGITDVHYVDPLLPYLFVGPICFQTEDRQRSGLSNMPGILSSHRTAQLLSRLLTSSYR